MTLDDWYSGGEFFTWKGHSIFVRDSGERSKPALLVVHGFPTASYDFHLMWSALAHTHRVLAFDMLGYGYSDKPAEWVHSIFNQASIAESLLAHKGVGTCEVLAHDVGNTVVQELMARQSEGKLGFVMRHITFLNGGLFPETHRPILIQKLMLSPLGPMMARFTQHATLRSNLQRICSSGLSEEDIDAAWTLLSHKQGNLRMHLLIRYMTERQENRDRWVGALQCSPAPIALIDGVEDPISGGHMVDRFEELVPGHRVVRLHGLGHYPHLENPARVLEAFYVPKSA
ncbi:alpha/beta fold hydrolase [Limnobacter sp.]|uniref:alpha/beta fold hydrolase n=1 Tax=Limnobacter sp. TaxID=2003368 RepID=UPI003516AADE